MSPLSQEIQFVADALRDAHLLQDRLDMPEWTASIRREVHELVSALTGHLLVADFALTGDGVAVEETFENMRDEGLYRLAA